MKTRAAKRAGQAGERCWACHGGDAVHVLFDAHPMSHSDGITYPLCPACCDVVHGRIDDCLAAMRTHTEEREQGS